MTQGPHDLADRIGSMLDDGARRGPIFQSVLEAVLRVLDDVSRREQIATAAAMSLGHRQVLQGLVDEVRWTIDRLATLRIRAAAAP